MNTCSYFKPFVCFDLTWNFLLLVKIILKFYNIYKDFILKQNFIIIIIAFTMTTRCVANDNQHYYD